MMDEKKARMMGQTAVADQAAAMKDYYFQKIAMLGGMTVASKLILKVGEVIAKNFAPGASVVTKAITSSAEVLMVLNNYRTGQASWTQVWTTFVAAGGEMAATAFTSSGLSGEAARLAIVESLRAAGVPENQLPPYGIVTELINAASQGNAGAQRLFQNLIGQDTMKSVEDAYKRKFARN
jgi:hypothetical protein